MDYGDWTADYCRVGRVEKNKGIGTLVVIRYLDHVLFRNSDPALFNPVIRECVGWLMKENAHAIWILWDRSAQDLRHERTDPRESGLVIIKNNVLEMKGIG